MRINYLLLVALIPIGISAQHSQSQFEYATHKLSTSEFNAKSKSIVNKAFLDTLFYEDFAGGVPAGWTVANNSGNSNNWIHGYGAPGGQFSTNADTLQSPSASNGYMLLPADLYNTPIPGPGPVPMDAYFSSPRLSPPSGSSIFPPSVVLRFYHSQRYCCSGANELVLEVSTDGTNFTAFDATGDRSPNTATPNGEELEINVSSVLGNDSAAYIRFRSTGNSHYYWMIDDVSLLEGPENAMIIDDEYIAYGDTSQLTYNPPFYQYPQAIMRPVDFGAFTSNYGTNTLTGVTINYEVLHDSTYSSGSGLGYLTRHIISLMGPLAPGGQFNQSVLPGFLGLVDGHFRANIWVTSDSLNQNSGAPMPADLITYNFVISDSIMDKTSGPYLGDAGPGNYAGGGNDGDRWASMHTMGRKSALATSISLLVANVTTNDGAQIQPRVWEWRDTGSTFATAIVEPPIGTSPFSVTIDTSMLANWITMPLFPPVILDSNTQYLVGWEQMGGANVGAEFTVARDRTRESYQPPVSNFVYINDANPGWGWVDQLGAIRLNFGGLTIGVDENLVQETIDFAVMPNPTNGNLKIVLKSNASKIYRLNVRNTLGQAVFSDDIFINGSKSIDLDLSGNDKGVYFITLENSSERLVKKIILN